MKLLVTSIVLMLLALSPQEVQAAPATSSAKVATASGRIKGVYDDPFASEYSDATPTATPRAVKTLSTADAPVSGAVENTVMLLGGGALLIFFGIKFSKK